MRRGGGVVAGLGVAALLLAAWVTTAGYVPAMRGTTDSTEHSDSDPSNVPHPPTGSGLDPRSAKPARVPPWLDVVFVVLLILFALALLTILVHRMRSRRRQRLLVNSRPAEADAAAEDADDLLAESLSRTAGEGVYRLSEGDPRNAIVRCWVMLEDTVAEAGLAPHRAFTSQEFTSHVLGRFAVAQPVLDELGQLYREARFSEHALTEDHRSRAVAALNRLREDLDAARADRAAQSAVADGPLS